MISHFFRFAHRVLLKHPLYTVIAVTGLAIGLAMGMIALSYVVRELRWEDCHANHDRIYRVEMSYTYMDTTFSSARIMAPLGDAIIDQIPGVQQAAVFRHEPNVTFTLNQRSYRAGNLIFARPEFFDVFTFPLKVGDPALCLKDPHSVLVSDSLARQYFPGENPIGKTIALIDSTTYTITGVLENPPALTQLRCDFIASYPTPSASAAAPDTWTRDCNDLVYLLLQDPSDPTTIGAQINSLFARHVSADIASRFAFSLKPLKSIYFSTYYSGNRGELGPGGEYDVLIFILSICLFILLQSIVNVVSLTTARSADRMREIGVRKALGADRPRLIRQFLGESLLISFAATILSLPLLDFLRSGFTRITPDRNELPNLYTEPATIALLVLLAVIVGLLAGYYPALQLSRNRPVAALKGQAAVGRSRWSLRKSLLVFQFTLAIFFITVTLAQHNQLQFITGYDLGFRRDNMLVLKFPGETGPRDCALMQHEVLNRPDILSAARSNLILGTRFFSRGYFLTDQRREEDIRFAKHYVGDYDFLSHYNLTVVKGRGFSPDQPGDIGRAILINESFATELGLANPIGSLLYTDSSFREIIGVVKDFQGTAMDWSYRASATISLSPDSCHVLCVRLKPDNISASITAIGGTWDRLFPNRQFAYTFLDDTIHAAYWELDSISALFGVFSIMSLLIASLGVFGLVSYTVTRKTKEIAIRKVMGASTAIIQRILTREFLLLIAIANLVALPLASLIISMSLEEYPFRAPFDLTVYIAGGILTGVIALATSAWHVLRASRANPTDALRHE